MILEIVTEGHPALRSKGTRVTKFDASLAALADDMLRTMYDADGVGLAAQQIGRPIQLCVVDVADVDDRPSALRIDGKSVDLETSMPMALVNPEIQPYGECTVMKEGCLSFPGLRGKVERPYSVRVKAQDLEGNVFHFEADGLLARAIQHEHDHLHGILFIDRMTEEERKKCRQAPLDL